MAYFDTFSTCFIYSSLAYICVTFVQYAWGRTAQIQERPAIVQDCNKTTLPETSLTIMKTVPKTMLPLPETRIEQTAYVAHRPTTIRELRLLCREYGIKGFSRFTKARCISELDHRDMLQSKGLM